MLTATSELAALSHGKVLVLHLREPSMFAVTSSETAREARSVLHEAVTKLTSAGIKAKGVTRDAVFGFAAKEISPKRATATPASS